MTATAPESVPGLQRLQNWFERNWKWVVPAGCGAMLAAAVAFVGVVLFAVMTTIRHSDPYAAAVSQARASAAVRHALGVPIREGWFVAGNVNVQLGGSGTASLSIPLSGPKGRGTLYVQATKSAGQWRFSQLVLALKGSDEELDLLDDHPRA